MLGVRLLIGIKRVGGVENEKFLYSKPHMSPLIFTRAMSVKDRLRCTRAKLSLVCKGTHKRVSLRLSSSIRGHMDVRNTVKRYLGCVRSKVMTLGRLRADRMCLISPCPPEAYLSS